MSGPSFIYVSFVVPVFSYFKCFRSRKNYHFRLLLGGFLDVTLWNVLKFVLNFELRCNAK